MEKERKKKMLRLIVVSQWLCTQVVSKSMRKEKKKRIIKFGEKIMKGNTNKT